jgi:ABC-type transporter Mla MlaB component
VLDAVAKFSNEKVPANLLEIDQLELSGISIPITNTKVNDKWKKTVEGLTFDGLAIGEQKYNKDKTPQLPIKFRRVRFFTSQKTLTEFGFSSLGNSNSQFKYGMEWDVDFGGLAKMLGLDSKLKGSLLVGWIPDPKGDICLGIRFDDMGGDKLDIGIGSLLRLKANTFSFGKYKLNSTDKIEQPYILASDVKVILFGDAFPKHSQFGLVLIPNPRDPLHGPLGWLTTVKSDEPIGPVKNLKVAIGQNLKYMGEKTTPEEITKDVVELAGFEINKNVNVPKIKDDTINAFLKKLQYCTGNDWFLAFSGGTSSGITGCAVYNPPSLLGGQVGTKNLTISLLYRQETPRLGTYTGTVLLSEKIGTIDAGPIKIQLHKIEVKADTDGGYSINIGLNEAKPDDFSKAAGAEVGVYKGDVALLIANINGAAIQRIPKYKNTTVIYTPASRIMMAGRFGLGRSFKKGILSAQASITFYGTFEGLIAERDLSNVPNGSNQLDPRGLPSQYFLIQAEVGIIAEVQGVVDFGVMRSRLDARLQIGFGCVLEMWKGADIYIRAELSINIYFEITPRKKLPFGIIIPAIKIHLKFSTSYEEKFKLIPDKSSQYNEYFEKERQALLEEVTTPQLRDTPDWSTKPDVSQKITIPLYLTLDSTLNDNQEDILVPLVVVPWGQSNSFHRDQSSQSPFQEIVRFIFEWSLNALFQQPPETISRAVLLECERRVASAKTIWAGDFAWDIFKQKFTFNLSKPPETKLQGAERGTVFILPGSFEVTITSKDTNNSTSFLLGEKRVSTTYLQELDSFFDKLRMSFEDRKDTLLPEAPSERLLLLFLYEEYLTSLLRSIWMSLVANINGDQSPSFTVSHLNGMLGQEIDSISGLVNRQIFSGARVPSTNGQTKTQSLWEAANLTFPANILGSVQSLTINATALGPDTAPVTFEEREGSVPDPLNSELDNPPTEPRIAVTSFKQLQPFDLTKTRHPLFESIPIQDINQENKFMWHLPMPLCLKSEQCKGEVSVRLLSLMNEPSNSTILRISDNPEITVSFTPYALISVPFSIEGRALVLQAMKESDRRLLKKVSKDIKPTSTIRFLIEENGNGQTSSFRELKDAKNCWIARVNLSTDPNPTSNQLRFFQDSTEPFADQATNIKSFLELLQLAAETNSGGFFFYNSSWKDISAQRIVVAISFPQESTSDQGRDYPLPAYINWIETTEPDSEHVYLLEEKDSIPVPVGHPGVLSAELIRPHPQTTYRDPTRPNSPRTLNREQALAILEYMNHGHCSGILREQDRLGFLPDDVLADASVDEVRLDSRFNLLEMTISSDGEFEELSGETDLPTPPCQKDNQENSDLIYHWSIPAYKRVIKIENDLLPNQQLPDQQDDFIYGTIGQTLTISAGFRDVLGFRPKQLPTDPPNSLRLKGLYFDPLIRWSELKGMKVNHYLDQKDMSLVVQLQFTHSNFAGEALITDKMSPYLLAMQQIRDTNVEYVIRSSLQTHILADTQRKELYEFLKSCPSFIKDEKFTIRVSLTSLDSIPNVADVYFAHIQICRTNKKLIWEVLLEGPAYKATLDLPIGSEPIGPEEDPSNMDNLIKVFASSLEKIYEKIEKGRVCIATSHNSLGAGELYILNRALLDLQKPKELGFAALKPISTNPYAKAKARIWDGKSPIDDSNKRKDIDIDIVDFDQDEAFNSYLQDLDLLLTPEKSLQLLDAKEPPMLLSKLLKIKGGLADWAANRAAAIYNGDEQDQVVEKSSRNLKDNLSNSFKKRLARITDVDTIILAPFTFEHQVEKQLLLYGRIQNNETSLTRVRPTIEANLLKHLRKHKIRTIESLLRFPKEELYALMPVPESPGLTAQSLDTLISLAREQKGPSSECFLPTALERGKNTSESTLVIQLDVRNPASQEILEADLEFSIEHIRLSLVNDEPIWLELVSPIPVKLGEAKIPILYKKLLRKPDISLAPPIPSQDRVEEGLPIANNLEWSLTFDVERTRAAIQDKVKIDILYNSCSNDKLFVQRGEQDLGEVLYEYLVTRSINKLPETLCYWGDLILNKLQLQALQTVESKSESLQQRLEMIEQKVGKDTLQIDLVRVSESDSDSFAALSYMIEGIDPLKELLDSSLPPERLRTNDKLASCTITKLVTNEYYSGRRISIGQLNVFHYENAWPAVSIKRNQEIHSRTVNEAFVYTTELVRLGESYTPMIIHEDVIELNQDDASLDLALLKFLKDVFLYFKSHNDEFPNFEMAWGFDSGQLDPFIENDPGMRIYDADPIGMFPPKSTNYNGLKDQIKVVMGSLEKWEKENTNSTRPQNGRYVFKLRVYSRFSQLEKPILVFNNLSYSF